MSFRRFLCMFLSVAVLSSLLVVAPSSVSPADAAGFCMGQAATVSGTTGTAGDDVIVGTTGADVIRGMGGHDLICGHGGNDRVTLQGGSAEVHGGYGWDFIDLRGGSSTGSNRVFGGAGNDTIFDSAGHSMLAGGSQDDRIYGGGGNDRIHGEGGNDLVDGGHGWDQIWGGPGNDTITGGFGNDTIFGQDGDDTIRTAGDNQPDQIQGGNGIDDIIGGPEDSAPDESLQLRLESVVNARVASGANSVCLSNDEVGLYQPFERSIVAYGALPVPAGASLYADSFHYAEENVSRDWAADAKVWVLDDGVVSEVRGDGYLSLSAGRYLVPSVESVIENRRLVTNGGSDSAIFVAGVRYREHAAGTPGPDANAAFGLRNFKVTRDGLTVPACAMEQLFACQLAGGTHVVTPGTEIEWAGKPLAVGCHVLPDCHFDVGDSKIANGLDWVFTNGCAFGTQVEASWVNGVAFVGSIDDMGDVLALLGDFVNGCISSIGDQAWSVIEMMTYNLTFMLDAPGNIETMYNTLRAAIDSDLSDLVRNAAAGVINMELYEENPVEWLGYVGCEILLEIALAAATAGSSLVAKFADEIADFTADLRRRFGNNNDGGDGNDGGTNTPSTCNSFPTGTLVLMADGSHKPINQIQPGDQVQAYNTETGIWSHRTVLDQWSHLETDQMATITLTDGSQVSATDHHLFWVNDQGEWVEAEHLKPGDLLLTPNGVAAIRDVNLWNTSGTLVWDITVKTDHTFAVGTGTHHVVVHNCSVRDLLRRAGLPGGAGQTGAFRYRAPEGIQVGNGLPREGLGYVDRFGNVWQQGPAHGRAFIEGHAFEWDVQLSESGRNAWGDSAQVGAGGQWYVNVTPDGHLSH